MTSIVFAPVALVSGDNEFSMHVAVPLAGAGVVVLAALLAREVAGARAGLIAAAIAAVYPNLWMNDGALMSETFATLATAGAVLCSYRLVRKPTIAAAATAGALCALAMLSRASWRFSCRSWCNRWYSGIGRSNGPSGFGLPVLPSAPPS